jgi:hypothetical protein
MLYCYNHDHINGQLVIRFGVLQLVACHEGYNRREIQQVYCLPVEELSWTQSFHDDYINWAHVLLMSGDKLEKCNGKLGFQVLTAVTMAYSPLKINRRFRRTCRFHLRGRKISQARNLQEAGSEQSLQRRLIFNGLHSVISQKVETYNRKFFRYGYFSNLLNDIFYD